MITPWPRITREDDHGFRLNAWARSVDTSSEFVEAREGSAVVDVVQFVNRHLLVEEDYECERVLERNQFRGLRSDDAIV